MHKTRNFFFQIEAGGKHTFHEVKTSTHECEKKGMSCCIVFVAFVLTCFRLMKDYASLFRF